MSLSLLVPTATVFPAPGNTVWGNTVWGNTMPANTVWG